MKYTFETWLLLALALLSKKHDSFGRNDPLGSSDKCLISKRKTQCQLFHSYTHRETFQVFKKKILHQ